MTLVSIDEQSSISPGEQLKSQLLLLILGGTLEAGSRLPSVRQLAADLGVAPGTVARVYKELEGSGHLTTRRTGTLVADLGVRAEEERNQHLEQAARAFADRTMRAGFNLGEALDAVRRVYREQTASS